MGKDLRSYLKMLEEKELLVRVKKQVDPLTRMGTLFSESDKPLLFENVVGYSGWKICGELTTNRDCQAAMLGVTKENIIRELARLIAEGPLEGKNVPDGPVKEKVFLDGEVDLRKIPVLIHSEFDASPYIGGGICVTKDPDTGIQNAAILRMQVKSANKTGVLITPRHTWKHYLKYEERNQPMPMAVVIGHHPLVDLASCYCGPYGLDEFELAGRLLGEPLEMVRCETIDLQVPAFSEIVLEGHVPPKVREKEGPFAEFQLYYSGGEGMNPVFNIKAITMRRDAIYRHIQATRFTEHQGLGVLPRTAHLYDRIKDVEGFIDIKDINMPLWGCGFLVIIQMIPHYEGQVKTVMMAALSSAYIEPSIVIVVDEDVDIRDPQDIFWAICTRVNPETDVFTVDHIRCNPLDIVKRLISPPGTAWQRQGGKMGIDATKPSTFRSEERARFKRAYPMGWGKISLKDVLGD